MELQSYTKRQSDIKHTESLDYTDAKVKEVETQVDKKLTKINTIADLRNTIGEYEGQVVELLGYYEAGQYSLKYQWTTKQGVDDGGSVINSGSGSWLAIFNEIIDVKYFGAKSESDYDNKMHFKNIVDYLSRNANKTLYVNSINNYETSETLVIPIDTDIHMLSFISFTNDSNSKGLIIGDTNYYNYRRKLLIRVRRKTLSDWEDKDNIGVLIYNLYESTEVYIQSVLNFTTGFKMIGDRKGFVYNTINIGVIADSRYSVVLSNINNGWCNENVFFINRIRVSSTTYLNKSRFGIVLTSEDGIYYNNNNVFYKPSIELTSNPSSECRAILLEYALYNKFDSVRNEGNNSGTNGSKIYLVKNESSNNIINEGYGLANTITNLTDEQGRHAGTFGDGIRTELRRPLKKPLIFDSGFIPNKISQYSSTQLKSTGYLAFASSAQQTMVKSTTSLTYNKDYLELIGSRGIGVTLDSTNCKKFFIQTFYKDNIQGRIRIRCFDANGNVLDNSVSSNNVKGTPDNLYNYQESSYKSWTTGSDTDRIYFQVSEQAVKIDLIISSGSSNLKLTRFQIFGVDAICDLLNWSTEGLTAISQPSNITNEGTFYYNINTSLNVHGWIYIGNAWVEVPKLVKSTAVANVNTTIPQQLTTYKFADLQEAENAVNNLVSVINTLLSNDSNLTDTLNSKLVADRNSGQQSIQ